MQMLFNQFMHIYFWVFLCYFIFAMIVNKKIKYEIIITLDLWKLIAITLFILSFKY